MLELSILHNEMIKIKSITDVITNSSTEVYTFVDEYGKENLKKFITGILKASGSDKTCDDLFEIRYMLKYGVDYYWDRYKDDLTLLYCVEKGIDIDEFSFLSLTDKEKRDYAEKFVMDYEWADEEGKPKPHTIGLIVEPIRSLGSSIPELDFINRIFDADSFYG